MAITNPPTPPADPRPEWYREHLRDQLIDKALRESLQASGRMGQQLNVLQSPHRLTAGEMVGGLFGAPAWSRRLKRIHDLSVALYDDLETAWGKHARRYRGKPEWFAKRWREYIEKTDLAALNEVIRKHNDYYPIEARIPIHQITGEYIVPPGIEHPKAEVTIEQLLREYPPDLDMAEYFTGPGARTRTG